MRPTPVQDRRPGTSADVPDVPSPTSMLAIACGLFRFFLFNFGFGDRKRKQDKENIRENMETKYQSLRSEKYRGIEV